jgi:hypothetical protein
MSDPAPGIQAVPHDDNLRYFDVIVIGPEGSPFAGKSHSSPPAIREGFSEGKGSLRAGRKAETSLSKRKGIISLRNLGRSDQRGVFINKGFIYPRSTCG